MFTRHAFFNINMCVAYSSCGAGPCWRLVCSAIRQIGFVLSKLIASPLN